MEKFPLTKFRYPYVCGLKKSEERKKLRHLSMKSKNEVTCFKIIVLGDINVGKTSLLVRYTDKTFDSKTISTVSFDYKEPEGIVINNNPVKVRIWDTAGQERFRTITTSFYRGAHGVILAYDVTNKQSFENLSSWTLDIDKYAQNGAKKMLVGCKIDNVEKRKVSFEEANQFAKENDLDYEETSSKDGSNVENMFMKIIQNIFNSNVPNNANTDNIARVGAHSIEKSSNKNCAC